MQCLPSHLQAVAAFEGHTGAISALAFSENGYYFATGGADALKLWDLRSLKNFKDLHPFDNEPTTCIAFDMSGQYLVSY